MRCDIVWALTSLLLAPRGPNSFGGSGPVAHALGGVAGSRESAGSRASVLAGCLLRQPGGVFGTEAERGRSSASMHRVVLGRGVRGEPGRRWGPRTPRPQAAVT